ncbi:MAG: hypothetical protein EP330_08085 [Deltaproteobacteria bacterium]|nr:MAG: hypothetical protein EP330_08085 [Deltaproteobacteria bacterium]
MDRDDDPFEPPESDAAPVGGSASEAPIHKFAAYAFLVCGTLITAWGLFSIIGTLTGALMGVVGIAAQEEEMLIAIPVFLMYGVWMVICLLAGPLQLVTGIRMIQGKPVERLRWAAAIGGLAATITVYCAVPGMIAFGLGLASALTKDD